MTSPTPHTGVTPTLITLLPCPTCGREVPWHHRQFHDPEPHCTRPTCRTDQIVEK